MSDFLSMHIPLGEAAMRIGVAMFFGGLIGLDREHQHKPAGVRTMMLVGLGSAAFVLAGEEMVGGIASDPAGHMAGITRVVQGIVGGIGFLGAGAIMRTELKVEGVTTAAAIWVTAGIGVACGLGAYGLAALCGVATLLTLTVVGLIEGRVFGWKRPNR